MQLRAQPDRTLRFVLCPDCAHDLIPVRVTVDASEAEMLGPTSRGPGGPTADLVRRVRADRRCEEPRLRLRASDLVSLAADQGMGRVQLVLRLRESGLVVDL